MENTTNVSVTGEGVVATPVSLTNKLVSSAFMIIVLSMILYFVMPEHGPLFFFLEAVFIFFVIRTLFSKQIDRDVTDAHHDKQELASRPSLVSLMTPQMKKLSALAVIVTVVANVASVVILKDASIVGVLDFIILFGGVIFLSHLQGMRAEKIVENLAVELGYTFARRGDLTTLPNDISTTGSTRELRNVISGMWGGYPIRLFTFCYESGRGKSRHEYHSVMFEVATNETFPVMTISPAGWIAESQSDIEISSSPLEDVALEGDFNSVFTVRCAPGAQMEIRQILSPDMMAYLMDNARGSRYIFIEGRVYVVASRGVQGTALLTREDYLQILERSKAMVSKWLETLRRME